MGCLRGEAGIVLTCLTGDIVWAEWMKCQEIENNICLPSVPVNGLVEQLCACNITWMPVKLWHQI